MRLGIHTSISKSLEDAARKAHGFGGNTFQIFSASPRMWRAAPPVPAAVLRLQAARADLDLHPLVVHGSYLVNLGSCDEVIRPKSVAAFRAEVLRCLALHADYLVIHPGNYKGQTVDEGIANVASALVEATAGLMPGALTILLENTAGCGAHLGGTFHELAAIRDGARSRTAFPIGYCLDTCHCLASGYDVSTAAGLRDTVKAADGVLGLQNVPVIHANDSKTPLHSHVDRHEHIGAGYIGKEGFRRILTHPKLRSKAFILETPQEQEGDEERNLRMLQTLCQKSSTTTA